VITDRKTAALGFSRLCRKSVVSFWLRTILHQLFFAILKIV